MGALVKPSLNLGMEAEDDDGVRKALVFFIREGREGAMVPGGRASDGGSADERFLIRLIMYQVQANRP